MKERIIKAADSPKELEALYRAEPREFSRSFPAVFAARPDSTVLRVWHERLFFKDVAETDERSIHAGWRAGDIGLTIAISLIAGTLARAPRFFSTLNDELFYLRNLAGIVGGALIVYFCIQTRCRMRTGVTLVSVLLGSLVYLSLLPDTTESDTNVLACLHMALVFWALMGIAFLGGDWRSLSGRMNFVRYNGELLIYCTVLVIGGMVFSGLTFALFQLIELNIEEWYIQNVAVYGAIGIPLVATLLITRIVGERFKIAPVLAKIFTPMFLLMVVVYLVTMVIKQRSPFTDRDFLIAFNGLLVVVLGLSVFSISERGSNDSANAVDLMNIGLVSITLVIDVIALAAILYRLSSFGFTPNRVAVLGANLLALCHLAGILYHYLRFARNRSPFDPLEQWIVRFIPAYIWWAIVVAVGLPILFRFA